MYILHIIQGLKLYSYWILQRIKSWICEGTKFYSKLDQIIFLQIQPTC